MRDVVFDRLRDAIIDGALHPGEAIVDREVEAWAGASRTPVREAIDRLVTVGLVVVVPQQGTRVAPLDDERTAQSFSLLGELLPDGLDWVVAELTPSQVAALQQRALTAHSAAELFARGGLLDLIVAAVGNPRYRQVWDELSPHVARAWNVYPDRAPSISGLDADRFARLVVAADPAASDVLRAWFAEVDATEPDAAASRGGN
jgi:DNA-binding GntR family transcriptional regulator